MTGQRELTWISKSAGHRRSRACDGFILPLDLPSNRKDNLNDCGNTYGSRNTE
jgi:hypothetical protein